MVKQTIQIFARIKPTKAALGVYDINDDTEGSHILNFNIPRDIASGFVNNKKEDHKFKFEKVFDRTTKQDEIFNAVAKPVVDSVLEGYNGTIFAYGQTGSGKTFTITGGPERYEHRGIIPRALAYVFQHCKNNPDFVFQIGISYLEIYNESGYDLLTKDNAEKMEDLPKVTTMVDEAGEMRLKNLSVCPANNEEEALGLLFTGDTNRMIAETPMNQASTRSHCIFTIHVMSRAAGSATTRQSKLHLVDLAGSERVSKTGVNGVLLTEAKYINLSLHYLESVIVKLSEKNWEHIPYRNSMMTSVLRDSLGGNCMTTMVATCSVEKKNLEESISTCRFAQRVAMVKNDAIQNEALDPQLVIASLKKQLAQLKEELAMATGEQRSDELTDEELNQCKELVNQYLEDMDPEAIINVGADMRKIQECYRLMKQAVLQRGKRPANVESSRSIKQEDPDDPQTYLDSAEKKKLQELILQRDNEINILVNMLKKEKKRAADATNRLDVLNHQASARPASENESRVFTAQNGFSAPRSLSVGSDLGAKKEWSPTDSQTSTRKTPDEGKNLPKKAGNMSVGRQEAFKTYSRDYVHNSAIEEKKKALRLKISEAKKLGEKIISIRNASSQTKTALQQHKDAQGPDQDVDERELQLRDQMLQQKKIYGDTSKRLRDLKIEIEHLQHLLEKSKLQMMKDFEDWWIQQTAKLQSDPVPQHTKPAWKTPPVTPSHNNGYASSTSSSASSLAPPNPHRPHTPKYTSGRSSTMSISTPSTPQGPPGRPPSGRRGPPAPLPAVGGVQLTGDEETDADIMAFMRARQRAQQGTGR